MEIPECGCIQVAAGGPRAPWLHDADLDGSGSGGISVGWDRPRGGW
jgi:hypothetical protein